jgi:hypothetical protein
MTMGENDIVEHRLKRLDIKPLPPGLRERILEAAATRRRETAWTTPGLRWALAACAAVLAVIFLMDAALGRRQQARLQVLLDGSQRIQSQAADETRLLAEALGEPVGRELVAQNGRAADRIRVEQVRREEVLKALLKEDFDVSESKKNSH